MGEGSSISGTSKLGKWNNLNLAIVAPSKDAYSETFIRAQIDRLPFHVFHYHDGNIPRQLDGEGVIENQSVKQRIFHRLHRAFGYEGSLHDKQLVRSFKKNKIDVVLAQYGSCGSEMSSICKKANIPLIVHFHGYDTSRRDILDKYSDGYRAMFEYASGILVVSEVMQQSIVSMGCHPDKIALNPCGPNEDFYSVEPNFQQAHVIGVGRFVDKKAPYYTILAFAKVAKEFPQARLTIGGDGPLWNICKNLVDHLGLSDKVDLPGVLTREQLMSYMESSLAFVQHSIIAENGDMEGTPVAILEASAAGLPVISTRHAGIPQAVLDEETGLLVEEHDVDGMAEKMKELLTKKDAASQMGMAGREHIKSSFSFERYIDLLTDVIIKAT